MLYTCQVKNVISPPFQKQPPSRRALTGGGSFFGFFRSFFVVWAQKNFWDGFWILLTFGRNVLIVCLFPAEKWVGSKKFSAKNGIFWSKWPKFNWNYKVKKWLSLSSWTILSISGGQKKQFFAVLGHILYIGGNFMGFTTLAGKQLFEPQQALWSKKALVFSWEIDKLKFFYEKWQL